METISSHDAELPDAARLNAFMDAGAKLGFDADTLRGMWTPAASVVTTPRSGLGLLTDAEWQIVRPMLPENVLAASGAYPRQMVDVMLWRVRYRHTGWRNLPPDLAPAPDMSRQRWARWIGGRVLADLFTALPDLDLSPERRQEIEALGRQVAQAEARAGE